MRRLPLLLTLVVGVALWAAPSSAQVAASSSPAGKGCHTWTLCDDQTALAACDLDAAGDGGDILFIRSQNEYTWTAFSQSSDSVTAYTIKLYSTSPGLGYDANHRVLVNYAGDITNLAPMFSWNGLMGDIHAVLGGTTTGGVTLVVKGCMLQGP